MWRGSILGNVGDRDDHDRHHLNSGFTHPLCDAAKSKDMEKLTPPPNFEAASSKVAKKSSSAVAEGSKTSSHERLKDKRAWELAISPAKSLPMNGFMLYMSGSSLQIFSIGILVMLLMNPFKAMVGINSVFAPLAPASSSPRSFTTLALQKLVYVACNLLTLALGLWKCNQLGLLPTGTGDWLAFETRGPSPELFG